LEYTDADAGTPKTGSPELDAGALVDEADNDGITGLSWAAISNRLDIARLLIQRGADVNHADKKGMTPLLYAASIDYGDPAKIELLLKSGAEAGARTKEGLTTLDLARKYNHTHLVASLEGPRAARQTGESGWRRGARTHACSVESPLDGVCAPG
jgi:uncharacterized protein